MRSAHIAQLELLSCLIFFSLWGLLTREGLVALNTYRGQSIQPVLWAQSVGCLVMGWAIANKKTVDALSPQLYTGITTGYCGSVTTFSSWVLQVFLAFSNHDRLARGGIYSVMDGLTQTGATIGISLIALQAGRALGESFLSWDNLVRCVQLPFSSLQRLVTKPEASSRTNGSAALVEAQEQVEVPLAEEKAKDEKGSAPRHHALHLILLVIGPLFWAGSAILFGTYPPFRNVTFPLLLSPPGAVLRWWLATKLNARFTSLPVSGSNGARRSLPRWPIGTLTANLLASAIIGGMYTAQRVGAGTNSAQLSAIHCQALYGVQEGFCGCLSTISTFAVELETLRPKRRAFAYALFSWTVGVLLCLLLVGVPSWTTGYEGRCAGVIY